MIGYLIGKKIKTKALFDKLRKLQGVGLALRIPPGISPVLIVYLI